MINSDINTNGLGDSTTGISTFHKQLPIATKKVPLKEVHNNSRSLLPTGKETSVLRENRAFADASKISGRKRQTSSLTNDDTNDQFMYSARKLESEVGNGKVPNKTHSSTDFPLLKNFPNVQPAVPTKQTRLNEKNVHLLSVTQPNNMACARLYSNGTTQMPKLSGKSANAFSEAPPFSGMAEQKRRERQNRLQSYINHCDDNSTQTALVQKLLHLSPVELSRCAVELEKRAIQLTIEEGIEMQRVNALNVLGKSETVKAPLQANQKLHPNN